MPVPAAVQEARTRLRPVLRAALATLAIFAVHHAYGAFRYATPWRLHGAVLALPIGAALAGLYAAHRAAPHTRGGRLAAGALVVSSVLLVVLVIGVFEGAYNHVLKDALFLAGVPRDLLVQFFPPPRYELPNDALFELSGVLQVVPALLTGVAAVRFIRARWTPRAGELD